MSSQDKWFFGFITLWVVLGAGWRDLIDAVNDRVSGRYACGQLEEQK